jgi:hypothetical protein
LVLGLKFISIYKIWTGPSTVLDNSPALWVTFFYAG